jgi:thioredoxin 1
MSTTHVNDDNFQAEVIDSSKPVLVDFFASWCGPCQMLAPTIEELANEQDKVKVVKVDVDDAPEVAAKYGIQSIPTLVLFEGGQAKAKKVGVVPKEDLEEMMGL